MIVKKNIAVSQTGFVFDPTTGDSFTLNPIGLEVLEQVRDGKPFNEIVAAITSKYDVDTTSFERYYYDFITSLKMYHLVEDYE